MVNFSHNRRHKTNMECCLAVTVSVTVGVVIVAVVVCIVVAAFSCSFNGMENEIYTIVNMCHLLSCSGRL